MSTLPLCRHNRTPLCQYPSTPRVFTAAYHGCSFRRRAKCAWPKLFRGVSCRMHVIARAYWEKYVHDIQHVGAPATTIVPLSIGLHPLFTSLLSVHINNVLVGYVDLLSAHLRKTRGSPAPSLQCLHLALLQHSMCVSVCCTNERTADQTNLPIPGYPDESAMVPVTLKIYILRNQFDALKQVDVDAWATEGDGTVPIAGNEGVFAVLHCLTAAYTRKKQPRAFGACGTAAATAAAATVEEGDVRMDMSDGTILDKLLTDFGDDDSDDDDAMDMVDLPLAPCLPADLQHSRKRKRLQGGHVKQANRMIDPPQHKFRRPSCDTSIDVTLQRTRVSAIDREELGAEDADDLSTYLIPQPDTIDDPPVHITVSAPVPSIVARLERLLTSASVDINGRPNRRMNILQPKGITFTLKGYQQHALRWLIHREKDVSCDEAQLRPPPLHPLFRKAVFVDRTPFYISQSKQCMTLHQIHSSPIPIGGILADEMGLGKTVEMIALMCTNRPAAHSTARLNLIVAPLTIVTQWDHEIQSKIRPPLRVCVYQGPQRLRDLRVLQHEYDVVITTYQTVAAEYREYAALDATVSPLVMSRRTLPLYDLEFYRIILDEAHYIKNRRAQQCVACVALRGVRRWCVTGTPIQNSVNDLYSLFKFLHISPHGNWSWWNAHIGRTFGKEDLPAVAALQRIMGTLMLRRTKARRTRDGGQLVALPPKTIQTSALPLGAAQGAFYTMLYEYMKTRFREFVEADAVLSNWTTVLEMLLRLRQACGHPALIFYNFHTKKVQQPLIQFLRAFISKYPAFIAQTVPFYSQLLRAPTVAIDVKAYMATHWCSSVKIEALLTHIKALRSHNRCPKTVVFSQWRSMLDLCAIALNRAGVRHIRIDGRIPRKERVTRLRTFRHAPTIEVILMSLGVGGLGLNLTCATTVILVDPWWNPAVEAQAIDRVHRIGQTNPVNVLKLVVSDSVEDKIIAMQLAKERIAQHVLGVHEASAAAAIQVPSQEAMRHLRLAHIHALFETEGYDAADSEADGEWSADREQETEEFAW